MIYTPHQERFNQTGSTASRPERLCVDCKFFKPYAENPKDNYRYARCLRNAAVVPDMSGEFCDINRDQPHRCGRGGLWFEPKEPPK